MDRVRQFSKIVRLASAGHGPSTSRRKSASLVELNYSFIAPSDKERKDRAEKISLKERFAKPLSRREKVAEGRMRGAICWTTTAKRRSRTPRDG